MATNTTLPVPEDPQKKGPDSDQTKDEDHLEDQSPPGVVERLESPFAAGQIIRAIISGAASGAVREGIELLLKHKSG